MSSRVVVAVGRSGASLALMLTRRCARQRSRLANDERGRPSPRPPSLDRLLGESRMYAYKKCLRCVCICPYVISTELECSSGQVPPCARTHVYSVWCFSHWQVLWGCWLRVLCLRACIRLWCGGTCTLHIYAYMHVSTYIYGSDGGGWALYYVSCGDWLLRRIYMHMHIRVYMISVWWLCAYLLYCSMCVYCKYIIHIIFRASAPVPLYMRKCICTHGLLLWGGTGAAAAAEQSAAAAGTESVTYYTYVYTHIHTTTHSIQYNAGTIQHNAIQNITIPLQCDTIQ